MSDTTEATRKAIYLSHFTPSMMPAEALESMLVQREPLLKNAVESIISSISSGSRHHQMFVGPRGIGKTHLISLIHHRISQNTEVKEKALIAWMREEEWGVTSFFELVMRILRNLNLAYPALEIDKLTQPLYELKLKDAEVKASDILASLIKNKVLIILMENLDDLFEQLGDTGQKQWRAFIQNHPQFVLVTTTPSLFSGVSAQKSVFYGFFDITQLDEFSFEEVSELLRKIAEYREDAELVSYLATPEGRARVRAVHHLAEGNPRIYIIFSQFLSKVALDELVQAFMHTLDELTPYYQARVKELSGQQRKILEFLISYRGASSVKDIAKACFLTSQTCSSQLKQLKDKRYVRAIPSGRESYYELRESLMRLCMSTKTERLEPIGLFIELLRIWYSEEELVQQLSKDFNEKVILNQYVIKAIELKRKEKVEPHIQAAFNSIVDGNEGQGQGAIEEFIELRTKNTNLQSLQLLLKIVLTKATEKEIVSGLPRILSLMKELSSQEITRREFVAIFQVFVMASILLEGEHKELNKELIVAIAEIADKKPTAVAMSTLASAQVIGFAQFKLWLDSYGSSLDMATVSKKTLVFFKTINRMLAAVTDAATMADSSKLIRLSREERLLVEPIIQRFQAASSKGHKIS